FGIVLFDGLHLDNQVVDSDRAVQALSKQIVHDILGSAVVLAVLHNGGRGESALALLGVGVVVPVRIAPDGAADLVHGPASVAGDVDGQVLQARLVRVYRTRGSGDIHRSSLVVCLLMIHTVILNVILHIHYMI